MSSKLRFPGILFLYEDPLVPEASTIREHVAAFGLHSRFAWYPLNVNFGLPPALAGYEFAAAVFHYSLRPTYRWLKGQLRDYLHHCAPHKVAIFQDEIWYFRERENFLSDYKINTLYSRHKPHHVRDIYSPNLPVAKYVHYLAGYVSDDLIVRTGRLNRPYADRPIDVGYRGRRLPPYFGRGGQEKGLIGERFAELVTGRNFNLDLAAREQDRLYGAHWDNFLANCKAVLGVEGGVSVVDPSDRFRALYEELIATNPGMTFAEFAGKAGPEFQALENRIDYRSLTPRHFESAAFRNLQILFEGRYDSIMQPWVHYVPLRKDFANIDEVLALLANPKRATEITDRAYADLIASGHYSERGFVRSFDEQLIADGVPASAKPNSKQDRWMRSYLAEWSRFQSRVRDFDQVCYRLTTASPPEPPAVVAAQLMLNAYRQDFDRRTPSARTWLRQARDRYLWKNVEDRLGQRVPARPEFDSRPRNLAVAEWLVTVPADFAQRIWSWTARKARGAAKRVLGPRR